MSRPKGYKHTKETRRKMSINSPRYWKGKNRSEEFKKQVSESLKGRPSPMKGKTPWNKGLNKEIDIRLKKVSDKLLNIRKNKTLEDLFGKEKARDWGEKISIANKRNYKLGKGPLWLRNKADGKDSLEEIYGEDKAKQIKQKIGNFNRGKILSKEQRQKIGEGNRDKYVSKETRTKMSIAHKGEKSSTFRKDITKEKVLKVFNDIIKIYGTDIGRMKLWELVCKELSCSDDLIINRYGSMDDILDEIEINIPRVSHWKPKEDLGIELCNELYGDGKVKLYHRVEDKKCFPDFTPNDISQPLIDIKSTTRDCYIIQKDKYERIRKDVRFMVFEDKGKTDVTSDRIIYMKEIIKQLPNNKRVIFQERYEKIKKNIPLEQQSLITKLYSSNKHQL